MHIKNIPPSPLHRQRGITLIESLVAIVISALGILGILGMQMRTLADTSTTVRRAQAIRLVEDLSERMKVSPNALSSLASYVSDFGDTPAPPGSCTTTTGCEPADQAAYDLAVWKQAVSNALPLGQASIFLAPGETDATNRRQLGIIIAWRENERAGTNTDDIDATRFNDSGTWRNAGGAANTCPDNFTCHLQYLSVAGRCAPYDNGSTITFYCS